MAVKTVVFVIVIQYSRSRVKRNSVLLVYVLINFFMVTSKLSDKCRILLEIR